MMLQGERSKDPLLAKLAYADLQRVIEDWEKSSLFNFSEGKNVTCCDGFNLSKESILKKMRLILASFAPLYPATEKEPAGNHR